MTAHSHSKLLSCPYLSAGAGSFTGSSEYKEHGPRDYESYEEVVRTDVLGARVSGRMDLLTGRDFVVGVNGGYIFDTVIKAHHVEARRLAEADYLADDILFPGSSGSFRIL